MYFIAAVGISARSRSKGKRVLIESELEFLQRQENTHRNKICKFKHYHSREFRVLRSTKISNTFFYIIHSHVTYASKLGLPVSDLQSRAKRVETLCLLKKNFRSRTSLFSFTPLPHFNVVAAAKSIGQSNILNIEKGEG